MTPKSIKSLSVDFHFRPDPYSLGFGVKNGSVHIWNDNSRCKAKIRKILACAFVGPPVPLRVKIGLKVTILTPHGYSPCNKPDISNMLKTIEDAGTGVIYTDDAQICSVRIDKHEGFSDEWKVRVTYKTYKNRCRWAK